MMGAGNLTKTTDARGFDTLYQYDALNRQTLEIDADPDGAPACPRYRRYMRMMRRAICKFLADRRDVDADHELCIYDALNRKITEMRMIPDGTGQTMHRRRRSMLTIRREYDQGD